LHGFSLSSPSQGFSNIIDELLYPREAESALRRERWRSGITLLITLAVIAAMLALIGVLFGYVERARNEADFKGALIQANLLRTDLSDLLKKVLKEKPTKETLQILYATPLFLQTEKGDFTITAHCSPLLNRLRISWLGNFQTKESDKRHQLALQIFEKLTETSEIKDPEYLLALIRDSLMGHTKRFGMKMDPQKEKGIIDLKEFRRILDEYRFARDDANVYRIRWSDYFTFTNPPEMKGVDGAFLSPSLMAELFELDLPLIQAEYRAGELESFLDSVGTDAQKYDWLFAKTTVVAMECQGSYTYREQSHPFRFEYIGQRIERFEIEGN
jgi:hypothetical protein